MTTPRLNIAIADYGHTRALKSGEVPIKGVEANFVAREGRTRQSEAVVGGRVDRAVPGTLAHEDDEPFDVEALSRGVGDCHVAEMRRVERAAVEDYSHSSNSSPSSTSSPVRAPAALRIASSSSSAGGVPVTRKPRSVR